MKTPRTILLARHRGIDPRLDAVREQVVASLVPPPAPAASPSPAASPAEWRVRRARAATGLWLELQLLAGSIRWHLAGLAALWIAAAVLSSLDPAARSEARAGGGRAEASRLEQWGASLRENRRELAELLGLAAQGVAAGGAPRTPAAPARSPAAPRRSATELNPGPVTVAGLV